MKNINFVDIQGIRVGHCHNKDAATGCTVILCEEGASGGVAVRGGSPGTRETDLLNPMEMIQKIHAVVLSGGSAFGLDSSSGVMKYLEKKGVGFDVGVAKVPIVCSAVLFDLAIGDSSIRPNSEMGFNACVDSENTYIDLQGNVGAGMGATIGKVLGPDYAMKGGLGCCAYEIGGLQVGAIVAVNAFGDVINPKTGEILAGAIDNNDNFLNSEITLINMHDQKVHGFKGNTTIGCIVTNGILNKAEANKISSMAHNGFARTIRPAHTMFDGDTIFTMATNKVQCDVNIVGVLATNAMEQAVINAITNAKSLYDIKSYNDLK